jgi:general stress protein 26
MSMSSFTDVADTFRARVERTVWCTMATVDRRGRPRSRIVHPIWEGATGWLLTGRASTKGRDLDRSPCTSLTYWDQVNEQVHVDCDTTWIEDLAERDRVWNLFKDAPFPVGYDPGLFFKAPDDPTCGVLRLVPHVLPVHVVDRPVEEVPHVGQDLHRRPALR